MLHEINPKRYKLNSPDTEFPERLTLTPTLPDGSLERALRGEQVPELKLNFPYDVPRENRSPAQLEMPKLKRRRREPAHLDTLPPDVLTANQLVDTPVFEPSWNLHTLERLPRSLSMPGILLKQKHSPKTPVLAFKRELEKYHAQCAAGHEQPRPPQPAADADWHATKVESTTGPMASYDPGAESSIHADPNPGLRDWRGVNAEPVTAEPTTEPGDWDWYSVDTQPPATGLKAEGFTVEANTEPPEWYTLDAHPQKPDVYPPRFVPSPPRYTRRTSLKRLNRGGADSPPAFAFGSPMPSDEAWPLTAEADFALRWAERNRRVRREVDGWWRR